MVAVFDCVCTAFVLTRPSARGPARFRHGIQSLDNERAAAEITVIKREPYTTFFSSGCRCVGRASRISSLGIPHAKAAYEVMLALTARRCQFPFPQLPVLSALHACVPIQHVPTVDGRRRRKTWRLRKCPPTRRIYTFSPRAQPPSQAEICPWFLGLIFDSVGMFEVIITGKTRPTS